MSAGGFAPDWPAPPSVRAWVTERGGSPRYGTMNLATHVGDDADAVAANRGRLRAELALPAEPSWLEQVHGARVLDLDREQLAPADGAVTARAGVVCAVLTADCLPVVLCDRAGGRVGVAHAGWRGLLAGVLPAAVAAFRQDPAEILAWLGPAIGPAAYEVGADVRDPFVARSQRRNAGLPAMPAAVGRPTSMASRATRSRRPVCGPFTAAGTARSPRPSGFSRTGARLRAAAWRRWHGSTQVRCGRSCRGGG